MCGEFCISKRQKNIVLSGENVSVRIKHAILQGLQVTFGRIATSSLYLF